MFFNAKEIGEQRLEKVLNKDKRENPTRICSLLKSEIKFILENYLEISSLDLDFNLINSEYQIKINATAKHIKSINTLP